MARRTTLKGLPPRQWRGSPTGSRAIYPWDEWLDGGVWAIAPDDYAGATLSGFRSQGFKAAQERGRVFGSRLLPGGTLLVQATRP